MPVRGGRDDSQEVRASSVMAKNARAVRCRPVGGRPWERMRGNDDCPGALSHKGVLQGQVDGSGDEAMYDLMKRFAARDC